MRKKHDYQKMETLELVCHGLPIGAVSPKPDDRSGSNFCKCCTAHLDRQGKSVGKSVRCFSLGEGQDLHGGGTSAAQEKSAELLH